MKQQLLALSILTTMILVGCGNDKDNTNTNSTKPEPSKPLTLEQTLKFADKNCWLGGTAKSSGLDLNANGKLDTNEIQKTENVCLTENVFAHGVRLNYEVMDIKGIVDGAKAGNHIEFRRGGFGSDLVAHPTEKNQFYALTDRGPNADYNLNKDNGKMFPDPSYTPRIGLFEVQSDGTVKKLKEILLKDRTGKNITGLPNLNFGATKEAAYDRYGKLLQQQTDEYGLDPEGIVALTDGTFWVSDEYGPHIVHYDATGKEIDRINAFAEDNRRIGGYLLPAEFSKRRPNRGMEGLTITPDGKTLVGIMQSTMDNPDSSTNKSDLTRIVTIDLASKVIKQYLYKQEGGAKAYSNSAITALSNTSFLVLERDGDFYKDNPDVFKRVYKIDLRHATNLEEVKETAQIKQDQKLGLTIDGLTLEQYVLAKGWDGLKALNIVPPSKILTLDMNQQVKFPHDKMEGLWLIDQQRLALINDDDFALWVNKGVLEQKYLDKDKKVIDGNTLYIVDGLDLKPIP
ncbi:esterase-like activity of phytase family protein [Acinetobacter defluvii]|uniref:Esterase-like activity of phytase family protein n=1 Tax=Acinetobacter defluvii TaxID=1871111 RepID=A0A2S2FCK2_9GAMM|nr:esterase-like activity of phytase family protein [Acinetobacter defluvii]AWL28620.1 esterase-like activity of phytase family protein [Acinetobacter defluvii]